MIEYTPHPLPKYDHTVVSWLAAEEDAILFWPPPPGKRGGGGRRKNGSKEASDDEAPPLEDDLFGDDSDGTDVSAPAGVGPGGGCGGATRRLGEGG